MFFEKKLKQFPFFLLQNLVTFGEHQKILLHKKNIFFPKLFFPHKQFSRFLFLLLNLVTFWGQHKFIFV